MNVEEPLGKADWISWSIFQWGWALPDAATESQWSHSARKSCWMEPLGPDQKPRLTVSSLRHCGRSTYQRSNQETQKLSAVRQRTTGVDVLSRRYPTSQGDGSSSSSISLPTWVFFQESRPPREARCPIEKLSAVVCFLKTSWTRR